MYIHVSYIRNYLPLENGRGASFEHAESLSFKAALCQVCINLPSGSAEEDFNILSKLLFPFGKRCGHLIEQTLNPFNQECFVQCLLEIGPVVLQKKISKFLQCIFTIS